MFRYNEHLNEKVEAYKACKIFCIRKIMVASSVIRRPFALI